MAGVKGQKSGGFGGRKQLPELEKKEARIMFRVTAKEKENINLFLKENNISLREIVLNFISPKINANIKKEEI
ncbi:MAG: hypothetical protein ACRC6A_11045 [Fusobacteriaceae bacterium]